MGGGHGRTRRETPTPGRVNPPSRARATTRRDGPCSLSRLRIGRPGWPSVRRLERSCWHGSSGRHRGSRLVGDAPRRSACSGGDVSLHHRAAAEGPLHRPARGRRPGRSRRSGPTSRSSGRISAIPARLEGVCAGATTVFHAAGLVHPRRVQDLYDVNVAGTRALLNAAIDARVKRFVLVSSNSPAGLNESPGRLMVEDDPPRPYLNYGLSKLQAEWSVNDAHRAGRIEGAIARPCWFYGPNQPPRQSKFFRMIKGGKPVVIGRGDNLRSMSYVDNTVQGLLLLDAVERAAGRTPRLQRPIWRNSSSQHFHRCRRFDSLVPAPKLRCRQFASRAPTPNVSTL